MHSITWMYRCVATLFLSLALFGHPAYSEHLSNKIEALIEKTLPQATVSILVKDLKDNHIIYSKNADKLLTPASGTKLFTAAAALYHFKPTQLFLTTLAKKNQNYYIKFDGSPSLTTDDLKHLLSHLQHAGIERIEGNVILDSTRFKPPYYSGGDSYDDLGWYYAAPCTAIILDENAASYEFISAQTLGNPVQIKPKSSNAGSLTLMNQLVTVSSETQKLHCNFNIDLKPGNTVRLFGCLSQTKEPRILKLAIPDPALLAKNIIKNALTESHIGLNGRILEGKMPNDAMPIASVPSKDLIQLITHMLQESDNLYANSLFKQLGYAITGEGSFKQGTYAVKNILSQFTRVDLEQIELADGSGSRYNLITANQIVTLLTDLYNEKKFQSIFLSTLPQAGVSGSLKDRMKDTPLEKKVFAKTGTMHDISSLSGYLLSNNNHSPLVFSIVINGVHKPIYLAKALEEDILNIIYQGQAV